MVHKDSKGFTLLELLIVIAIIGILSVVVILVLNPAETLKKARDSQRMADLNTLKTAIGLFITNTSTPYLGMGGTSNTGCGPAGTRYIWYSNANVNGTANDGGAVTATSSAVAANVNKTDGSGWVPVNFESLVGGSPISNLPADPVGTVASVSAPVSTDLVYRYGCSTTTMQFEINAQLESNTYTVQDNKKVSDGGNNSAYYEIGSSLNVLGAGTSF